ncbi:hypothetical protein SKUD_197004 [Saccharomyces kudriavzevii IFO 1802]|uniref:Uncharacterized protein n=1 Tax=Saccharomyces kudriavzevii (strain ATCC MYA-4449 / AS 2.2408 / CBS 8840 / NBRC 1802 / NCYC 2889) TaxID=226230 RepID=J8TX39_SACK1|nr:hypothetical protein SKUD_197004 [Saccharomyces kudriavzevii IFO 1802]
MEDTKVEDEKNVGLLSSGYLESQKIVLPKDVFRNGFTWFCYETFKSLAFRIWLLSWLPVTAWWKMSTNWIYPFLATNLLILCVFFCLLFKCCVVNVPYRKISPSFLKKSLQTLQVLTSKTGNLLQQILTHICMKTILENQVLFL